jgi:excisionase family DNA binding protein
MGQDTMTPAEAAAYLHLSASTVKRKAREGSVPGAKTGRKWVFRRADLDNWLSAGAALREQLEDEGLLMAMEEAKADPRNHQGVPLEQFLRERGL